MGSGAHERCEIRKRDWFAEQIALNDGAPMFFEEVALCFDLDALGNDRQTQASGKRDDRLHHHGVGSAVRQIADERLVDLDLRSAMSLACTAAEKANPNANSAFGSQSRNRRTVPIMSRVQSRPSMEAHPNGIAHHGSMGEYGQYRPPCLQRAPHRLRP